MHCAWYNAITAAFDIALRPNTGVHTQESVLFPN